VDNRTLAAFVMQLRVISPRKQEQHYGPRTEVEGNEITNAVPVVTRDWQDEASRLDSLHSHDDRIPATGHDAVRVQIAILDDPREIVDMGDVVNDRAIWRNTHCGQPAHSTLA